MTERFYITTPIYYPNGEPHLGHVYTTLCCDTLARYHRLVGHDTFFLTGTDEHGVKMVKTALAAGIEPRALADINVAIFENLWKEMGITNDDFIRTTSDRHKAGVQEIVRRMIAKDDIYQGSYEGWYDESQEEFVTETEAKANQHKSAVSGRPLTRYAEKSYFFRLSKYAPKVLAYIEANPSFVQPDSRRNEILSKLKAGVEDLSISRATLAWGIPMPNDPEHVIYVWIDALSNYITALGFGQKSEGGNQKAEGENLYEKFWPGIHLIGKEISWFHTVYWPAMLMSLGEQLPKQVYAHGWWTSDGKKMSKTLGNFVDMVKLREIIANYSLDGLRYYLLRAAPFGSDLDFSTSDFTKSFNELANVLGNCLNRTVKMIGRYREATVPATGELEQIDRDLVAKIEEMPAALHRAYEKLTLQDAVMIPIDLARATNGYIDSTEPFKLAKDQSKTGRLDTVLNLSARAIHAVLAALLPVLPTKAAAGLAQLNIDTNGKSLDELLTAPPAAGHKIGEGVPLFPKVV